jgi:5'-deoxynucleotidase YfbR-like HD superfamily hydrolase
MASTVPTEAASGALSRLERQIAFIIELDKLKHVLRQTRLMDGSRRENDAEHCWHVALMAVVLAEHCSTGIDVLRVLTMLLIHDVVEIDAGDTFLYAAVDAAVMAARETRAAERIFGLLPPDQAGELRALWEEFEARQTAEAKFARALDRLEPLLQNHCNGGGTWVEHGITVEQVLAKKHIVADGSTALWAFAVELIDDSLRRGYLRAAEQKTSP